MRVMMFKVGKKPYIKEIKENLEELQKLVGGYLETLTDLKNGVCLVFNEEGRLKGLPYNRDFVLSYGVVSIVGDAFICGIEGDDFGDLTGEQVNYLTRLYC